MDTPTISLIIPAFNEEKYIASCLACVNKYASGAIFEVIVVDNASTDRTSEIAQSFADVRVIREDKKGVNAARQRGFEESRGSIVAYIDADTAMPEGWIDMIVHAFSQDDSLALLSGPYIYNDIPRFERMLVWCYWHLLAVPTYWIVGYMAVGGNMALRRDALLKMNGFDATISFYGDDTDIARRARKIGTVRFDPRFVMYTSGRRLAGEGIAKTAWRYVINFFSEVFFHRPATTSHNDIR